MRLEQWLEHVVPEDADRVRLELDLHLRALTPHFECEYRVLEEDGSVRWMVSRGHALCREDGRPYRVAGSLTDITERKRQEEELLHNALYDGLTGLPNRALYQDRLQFLYQRRERDPDHVFAVLYLDLDRFKTVNESFGHSAGDALLEKAGDRLMALVSHG